MKNVNNFQAANFRPQGLLLSICLIFRQFQLDFAYSSVAYKIKRVTELNFLI